MRKKWYKVSFYAKMSQDDVRAMNKYLYDTMNEAMEIDECEQLSIEEDEPNDYEEADYDETLYEDDYQLDDETGNLMVPREAFNHTYNVGNHLTILFMENDTIIHYKVIEITPDDIILEYIEVVDQ